MSYLCINGEDTIAHICMMTRVSVTTIVNWMNLCRDVCKKSLSRELKMRSFRQPSRVG